MRRYYAAPSFLYRLSALRRNIRIEFSRLVTKQEKKLRAIVKYAYKNVSFYHKLFDASNVKPTDINTISDLKTIPIVTRKDVQRNLGNMISRKIDAERCEKHKTSGTAGIPIAILLDNHAKKYRWAVSFRQFLECGGRLRDKQVQLRGHEAPIVPNSKSKPFYEYIGLLRTEWIAIRGSIPGFVTHFLEEYRPDVMVGYPSLFEMLSEMISDTIKPRIIFCTGEVLSSHCRNVMNSTFGARIIDSYGCTEIGDIAWECPEEDIGYHVNADTVLVEFIKDGENVAPGEEGEIVLTNLYNYAMPLIRYNTGDVGVPSDEHCSCGRTLPLMQLLKGRSDDFIVLPDGKKLSPMCIKENFVEVSEYRIVQEKRNLIVIWLKMHDGYKDASVTWCASALRKVIGENVRIKTRVVNEIPRDNSGKLRRIISKVN